MMIVFHLLYFSAAGLLLTYGLNCYYLIRLHRRALRERAAGADSEESVEGLADQSLPTVVTQLPIYNEANVAERVMRAAAAMTYPEGRHEVQVLDDSTDGTRSRVDRTAEELRAAGKRVSVVRRADRRGFKAGALAHGLEHTDAELVAIFDADFVPPSNFLLRLAPAFQENERLGLAQARWGHLNPGHSILTFAQSIGIDGHFTIEQVARSGGGLFMNFNGTAGIWRRRTIEDAGGWSSDTLTEDLDLSYRAQLAGWKTRFFSDVVVPAEIPGTVAGFKSQQFRWAKGSIQTAKKLFPRVFRAPLPFRVKVQAFFHLTHYLIHPLIVFIAVLALPVLWTLPLHLPPAAFALVALILATAMAGPSSLYFVSQRQLYPNGLRRLLFLPALMAVGIGLAVSNGRAVAEGFFGRKAGEFVRTPKRGDRPGGLRYRVTGKVGPVWELGLGAYCALSLFFYLQAQNYLIGPFLALYMVGFLFIGLGGFIEAMDFSRRLARPARRETP